MSTNVTWEAHDDSAQKCLGDERRNPVAALIDDSIVEAARGVELGNADFRFGDLPETLGQLLADGDIVRVDVDSNGNVVRIED